MTDLGREVVFDVEHKPGVSNLLTILSALSATPVEILEKRFVGAGYGDLKKEVAAVYTDFAGDFAEKTHRWLADPAALDDVLADGAVRARAISGERLADMYRKVGFA